LLEAFLPFLPLFVFVMANATAFGLWWGFFFSWIGAVVGAFLVFSIVRKFGQARVFLFLQKHKQVQRLTNWVENHGFGPLFIMLCFPFTFIMIDQKSCVDMQDFFFFSNRAIILNNTQ
jgi:uncharacterized membrane protein YdjX (TVP38/TMEM64 family)